MAREVSNENVGFQLLMTAVPSTAFKTTLDTTTANGTDLDAAKGLLVKWTLSNNFEVAAVVNDTMPCGKIVGIEGDSVNGYILTIETWVVISSSSTFYVTRCLHLPYSSATIALGDEVQSFGTTYYVETAAGSGSGVVVAKDVETGFVDVLI